MAVALVARSIEQGGFNRVKRFMSDQEQALYKLDPNRYARYLGTAIHKATAARLQGLFGRRFIYNRRHADTGRMRPDFVDTKTDEFIELTTKSDMPSHRRRYRRFLDRTTFVMYRYQP